jgi:hypothetical protein
MRKESNAILVLEICFLLVMVVENLLVMKEFLCIGDERMLMCW